MDREEQQWEDYWDRQSNTNDTDDCAGFVSDESDKDDNEKK